jgi:hypothetical protein
MGVFLDLVAAGDYARHTSTGAADTALVAMTIHDDDDDDDDDEHADVSSDSVVDDHDDDDALASAEATASEDLPHVMRPRTGTTPLPPVMLTSVMCVVLWCADVL